MSDPKRATLITVGDPKSEKNKVNKTVRLTINLVESNESKYPELNYKELVKAEELRKKKVENGRSGGLNPFSDNDDDVERVAKKFEQKYGGKSTYGRKGRSKHDDFADIGAGYDENDSFIDNTDGYDEMIPPECDTFYGGFYINSGSLEFKNVVNASADMSDGDIAAGRRNKRRMSSSSSEESSSVSSTASESLDEKEPKPVANGELHAHDPDHRKKKNKKHDKKMAKKIRRTDSSAANSGKQTSDDNNHGDAESADSRTSQSDSLTSKPAPSSENAVTSDSSRDVEAKTEALPSAVLQVLEDLEAAVSRQLDGNPDTLVKDMDSRTEQYVIRLERALSSCGAEARRRAAWSRAARALAVPRARLLQRARALRPPAAPAAPPAPPPAHPPAPAASDPPALPTQSAPNTATAATASAAHNNKRKNLEQEPLDVSNMTEEERETNITDTLIRLKALIDERTPGMMATYNAECERVQEERKKLQIASEADGVPHIEKRLPKRRFPWCSRSRGLLGRLVALCAGRAGGAGDARVLLAQRALPLFPAGFVRIPTLLRQADLKQDTKGTEMKRQRLGSCSMPAQPGLPMQFTEPITFPSSLTVTTMKTSPVKNEYNHDESKYKSTNSVFGSIINAYSLNKDTLNEKKTSFNFSRDLVAEKQEERKKGNKINLNKDYVIERQDHKKAPVNLNKDLLIEKQDSKKAFNFSKETVQDDRKKSCNISKDLIIEKDVRKDSVTKEDLYIPPNNIGSITITPVPIVPSKVDKKINTTTEKHKEGLIRVKSPAALNEMVNKKEKEKVQDPNKKDKPRKPDKNQSNVKEKKLDSPLHIDTSFQPKQKEPTPSPKSKAEEVTQKQIESMRVAENNIPRPALVPVHISPTFAKPDKRPPEVKKKKEIVIVSDLDPLGDVQQEPLAIDDSSSDVEVVEDNKYEKPSVKSDVPSNKVSRESNHTSDARHSKELVKDGERKSDKLDEATKEDFDSLMKNLRDLEHSQEPKFSSNSYGGVITSAQSELL